MYRIKRIYIVNIFLINLFLLLAVGCNIQKSEFAATMDEPTPTDEAIPTLSAYRTLLDTEIRGLDSATIDGYLTGKGLGLALPAELNGYPGPRHVLDLADDLTLSAEQTDQIQALFDEMQPQAIELGKEILLAEAKLEEAFREKIIDDDFLYFQLKTISDLQTQLRYVHLRTHLTTIDILSPHQIVLYDTLRGYRDMPANHQHGQQYN